MKRETERLREGGRFIGMDTLCPIPLLFHL